MSSPSQADVLALIGYLVTANRSGRYIVLVYDPRIRIEARISSALCAHGPFGSVEATARMNELSTNFAADPELSDVRVTLVPWEEL